MLELRFARYWRMASLAGMLLVLAAALVPADWLWPDTGDLGWFFNDKWLHAITFAFLAVWFCGQYARASYWRVAVGLLAFGLLIEICQQATVYRSADLKDLMANLAGLISGFLIALVGAGGWSQRFENLVYKQRD